MFKHVESLVGKFQVDAMAADDGHNAMRREFHSPGRSFFEREDFSVLTWCFPPKDMIGLVLKFWESKHRAKVPSRIVLLVPESPRAPWWHHLKYFKPLMRYRAQSDLFREFGPDGLWVKCPQARVPYLVLKAPDE